jgi:hypothetical protein
MGMRPILITTLTLCRVSNAFTATMKTLVTGLSSYLELIWMKISTSTLTLLLSQTNFLEHSSLLTLSLAAIKKSIEWRLQVQIAFLTEVDLAPSRPE